MNTAEARSLAATLLAEELPQRWRHVQAVGYRAMTVAPLVGDRDDVLVRAAWLHDIGYAPGLAVTGFHPLDGALYLDSIGAPHRLVCLVAHHTCARTEAELRGLGAKLAQFADESGALRDALWYCDITTSPDGEPVKAAKRIREIKRRYGPGNVVTRAIADATPELLGAVQRTEQLMAQYHGAWPG